MADTFVRIRISGTLPGGEVWSVAPALVGTETGETVPSHAELQTWADTVAPIFESALPAGLGRALSNQAFVTGIRLETYNALSRLSDYATAAVDPASGVTGLRLPPTTAAVVSIQTAQVGRAGRGRAYWPALGLTLETATGRFAAADTSAIASGFATLMDQVCDEAPASYPCGIGLFSPSLGSARLATSLRVGNVPDGQRSRKDGLAEAYEVVAVNP